MVNLRRDMYEDRWFLVQPRKILVKIWPKSKVSPNTGEHRHVQCLKSAPLHIVLRYRYRATGHCIIYTKPGVEPRWKTNPESLV